MWYCGRRKQIAEQRRKDGTARSVDSSETSTTSSVGGSSLRPVKGTEPLRVFSDKSCPYCFLVCASMQSRRRHIVNIHPEKADEPEVDQHTYVRMVSAALPYECGQCCKAFASHPSLSLHRRRVHEDRKDHVCPTCSRRYPLGSELRKHIRRVHEKPLSHCIFTSAKLSA
ncbi:unnamed protein product [Heligmosomoides polygyrus]|uniref:Zinc finger, C2H2 type n=1 Tax=Heligmosomoides polygyrus TaxID=6339 RepID=A0A183FD08_HELPZ|nr:unnamed protein product [Heligmosomoides polygyrus]